MAEEFENTSQDTQADVKGAGTMLAAPFEIARQDTLTEVQQTVNKTDATIGDIGDPAGEESLVGLIKNIPETVPTGAVKSVQRGVVQAKGSNTGQNFEITISNVEPSKCIISLHSGIMGGISNACGTGAFVKELTKNKLTVFAITPDSSERASFSWEVSEFF